MATELRVGVVGAGANTRQRHIPGLQKIDGVDVVSVSNRSRSSSERAAAECTIPTVYDNWRQLVEAPDTNAIMIGTWPYLHCPITLAALAAGKHVLTEARMAMNAAEAHEMLAASRRHPELTCMVVPSPFTLYADRAIQQKLSDGYLGELISVDLQGATAGFVDFDAPESWRQSRDMSGYNILNLGIWYEALMRWTGPATRVMASTRVVVKQHRDPETGSLKPTTVPDHVEAIADLANGAIAHIQISGVTGLARPAQVWLYGSEGTLNYEPFTRKFSGGRRSDKQLGEIAIPAELQGAWQVEEEFVAAVRGESPVRLTTFEDGVRYMEFTEAVSRSSASGKAIPLPLQRV